MNDPTMDAVTRAVNAELAESAGPLLNGTEWAAVAAAVESEAARREGVAKRLYRGRDRLAAVPHQAAANNLRAMASAIRDARARFQQEQAETPAS